VLYDKYYVDEIYDFFIREINNGLSRFFRDNVETTLASSFGLGKVTNEIGFQGKKYKAEVLVLSFCLCLGMCAIVTYLFLANNFIL
jgi:NADH-quinone oxidoreductase subunit L